jgi:hypothetical protein
MKRTPILLLRIGIAFAFLYVAYAAFTDPVSWLSYLPSFVTGLGFSMTTLGIGLTTFHAVIGLWILSGWRIFIPSLIAALFLGAAVYVNQNQLDILFRDVSLGLAALALAFSSRR